MRSLLFPILFLILTSALPALAADGDESCLKCHNDRAALEKARTDASRSIDSLLVDAERYQRSVHEQVGCAECHFDYDTHPHGQDAESVTCTECHDEIGQEYAASVHGKGAESGMPTADCAACHGVHDVLKPTDRDSTLYPLNVHLTCGKCHFGIDPAKATTDELLNEPHLGDSHGYGILRQGLIVSATCVSCHGSHGIKPKGDPDSVIARTRVSAKCGECHLGAWEDYKQSIHFVKHTETEQQGATCSDCHRPHHMTQKERSFRAQSLETCAECHQERSGSFLLSYHGKRAMVGFEEDVATCGDCHANHLVLPGSDPRSSIHENNIVATCAKCHPKSHEEFATYKVHIDPSDPEGDSRIHLIWVIMNTLFVGVLIVGCLHAGLWLVRATLAGDWKRPPPSKEEKRIYRRWRPSYVFYHLVLMTSVLMLAMTGLPLHFADRPWAIKVMNLFGGAGAAGYIHRVFAVMMVALVVVYMIEIGYRLIAKREKGIFFGPNTMLPRVKDLQDVIGNFRWFLFLGERPKYDRWTYWEKFDFWAVFWGTFVIGVSGLMLWFPEQATRFVPGWFLNAAVVIHGIEALLDIAFIFTVHVFHANLRPDKFPMDPLFYTGRFDEHEFRVDRPLEYERAIREGTIETMMARTPRARTRVIAYVIGTLSLMVGFFFLAAMLIAMLTR